MSFLEKFFAGAFGLILVYLLVRNFNGVNAILRGFAQGSSQVFSTLQGNAGFGGVGNFSPSVNVGVG